MPQQYRLNRPCKTPQILSTACPFVAERTGQSWSFAYHTETPTSFLIVCLVSGKMVPNSVGFRIYLSRFSWRLQIDSCKERNARQSPSWWSCLMPFAWYDTSSNPMDTEPHVWIQQLWVSLVEGWFSGFGNPAIWCIFEIVLLHIWFVWYLGVCTKYVLRMILWYPIHSLY